MKVNKKTYMNSKIYKLLDNTNGNIVFFNIKKC